MSGTATTTVYDFDEALQTEIVALLMWDHDFLKQTDGLIQPEYFEDDIERGFARLALDFHAKYGEAPSGTAWIQLVKDAYALKPPLWRDDQKAEVVAKLKTTQALTIRSRAFVLDKIAEFARQQEITRAMFAAAAELGKTHDPDRFTRMQERMEAAFKVGLKTGDEDYDFFDRASERAEIRVERAKGGRPRTGIPTGIPELDMLLKTHGGWGRKELSLFMGAMKSSKSFNLTSAAAAAVMLGYNVLFISCENSVEVQASRIEAYISEIGISDFMSMPSTVEAAINSAAKVAGKLKIRYYPMMSFRPRDLERLLDEYKTKGLSFDLVVIDYLDVMIPDHITDSSTENSKNVYARCRGIASQEDFALLSATQTNREGAKAAVAQGTHVAEDINRVRIADIVISINRTEDERISGKARLYIALARNERDGVTIFVTQDLDKGRAVASVENVE